MQNPYPAVFTLHVTSTQSDPTIAAFPLHVAKPYFLLVKYCMLLTRHSLKDSCSSVFKLHVASIMQNMAFALFTLHVTISPLLFVNCM